MPNPEARWGSLPFAEQIAFFKDKVNLPTATWRDLLGAAHDRAFVVAGAMKADLLADLHAAVLKGIEQGTTLAEFRRDFDSLVAKHGWSGWTGEGTDQGRAWRTRVIYDTNLRTSYQAGRHAQAQAVAHRRPFWRYVHNSTVLDPRPEHVAWHGTILRADDPWWQTHWPPNGWGCRCRVETLAQRDLDRLGKSGPDPTPDDGTYEWLDKRTGKTHTIPKGIDPGWDYTPGASLAKPLRELIDQKMLNLDAPVGAALWKEMAMPETLVAMETRRAVEEMVDRVAREQQYHGESLTVHAVAPTTLADLSAVHQIELQSAGVWLRDEELLHALRDTKDARGRALPAEVWRDLPRLLAGATPYLDTLDRALIYAFDLPDGTGKVVVRVNYSEKVRIDGKRERITANFVRTGGLVERHNLEEQRYVELKK